MMTPTTIRPGFPAAKRAAPPLGDPREVLKRAASQALGIWRDSGNTEALRLANCLSAAGDGLPGSPIMVSVCAYCDSAKRRVLEDFAAEHELPVTHGICPPCARFITAEIEAARLQREDAL